METDILNNNWHKYSNKFIVYGSDNWYRRELDWVHVKGEAAVAISNQRLR